MNRRNWICTLTFVALMATAGLARAAALTWVDSGSFSVVDVVGGGVSLTGNGPLPEAFTGSAATIATDASATYAGLAQGSFLGNPLDFYFAQTGVDGGSHPLPSLDFANGTADFGGLYGNFNGEEFYMGGTATLTQVSATSWDVFLTSEQASGPFGGTTVGFSMTVAVTPEAFVPLPAAVWLFGSGLVGLMGLARRGH
ncbi:VPLPA-CTERM sorting domain-containing protein [Thiohalobacter sp.]|uniref:VPLPA-CTERM sorting domain-containing protein n=1 Tax=Thiohalobacter sp. TaxID=2025948 RepID=UPI0026214E1C|nr:VPLPA-CTERM sorting domain-containing protein [Thiohalobacter sp.]